MPDICSLLTPELAPQYAVRFRKLLSLRRYVYADASEEDPNVALGEATLRRATAHIALDLPLDQIWTQQEVVLNDLISAYGLAPGEKATFSVKRSQRRQIDRKTVEEKTQIRSEESKIVDKDVLSLARTFVANTNAKVTSSGKISLSGLDLGGTNEFTTAFGETIAATSESLREAMLNASEQLKLTYKVEISEEVETTEERTEKREVTNPYKDRACQIHFFDMLKRYRVSSQFSSTATNVGVALVLDFEDLYFSVHFVRRNTAFLLEHLVERTLMDEYSALLSNAEASFDLEYGSETERVAEVALDFLFRVDDLFGLPDDNGRHLVHNSFVTQGSDRPFDQSALSDALLENAEMTKLYTGLTYFYNIYRQLVRNEVAGGIAYTNVDSDTMNGLKFVPFGDPSEISQFKADLAVAIADFLSEHLAAVEEAQMRLVTDLNNRTEVFRRLVGFRAMVLSMVSDRRAGDAPARARDRRLSALEARLAEHLQAYDGHYRQRYVEFIAERLSQVEFSDTLRSLMPIFVAQGLPPLASLAENFAFERGYVEDSKYVVPSNISGNLGDVVEELDDLVPGFGMDVPDELIFESNFEAEIPVDGVHIEAVPGFCRLPDLDGGGDNGVDLDVSITGKIS